MENRASVDIYVLYDGRSLMYIFFLNISAQKYKKRKYCVDINLYKIYNL